MVYTDSYDCCYEAVGVAGNSLKRLDAPVQTVLGHYACYASIYRQIKEYKYADVTYRIYIPAEDIQDLPYNLCTKTETKKILRCLQKTVDFSYKFSKAVYKQGKYATQNINYTVLIVRIIGKAPQHIWLTSMLRALYEWPFNIAAKEACELQSELKVVDGVDLSKVNWINLYLTISAQLGCEGLHGMASWEKQPNAKTYHEWKQKIASLRKGDTVINQISQIRKIPRQTAQKFYIFSEEIYNEGVESRASKYVAAYKDKLTWKK